MRDAPDAADHPAARALVSRVADIKKRLVGRRIVAADARATYEGDPGSKDRRWMHDWKLRLDDGTIVYFVVEEHPLGAEYGIDIGVTEKR